MTKKYKVTMRLYVILLIFLIILTSAVKGGMVYTHAAVDTVSAYESRNVIYDLAESSIDGESFDFTDYRFSETLPVKILAFIEFGYSLRSDKKDDFGLYVYVYNPQGLDWTKNESLNKITVRPKGLNNYLKVGLKYLNRSNAAGYEGMFYKFKLDLTAAQKAYMLSVTAEERTYEVSEIELYETGTNATAYEVANKYTYTGYSEGYGSDSAAESSLSCKVDRFDTIINLDVKHTTYRAEGDYYNGEQSQLDSVYFRVPNKYLTDYGSLTEIACEWYEYFTKPILVTEDLLTYSAINALHGKDTTALSSDRYFLFNAYWENLKSSWVGIRTGESSWTSNYGYQPGDKYNFGFLGADSETFSDMQFSNFAAAFYTNGESYKDFVVKKEDIKEKLQSNSSYLGSPYIHSTYSSALFEDYVQDGRTMDYNYKEIKATDEQDIFWNKTTKNLWQNMFTGTTSVETIHDSLKAIVMVSDTDLKGDDEVIAENLKVSERDVNSIKAEHTKAQQNDETLVLFRFSSTSYFAAPGVSSYCDKDDIDGGKTLAKANWNQWYGKRFNCGIRQETVYLSFDIISLTFSKKGVDTVIPVVMSPIDIIQELTPRLPSDDYDSNSIAWWVWVIVGIAVVVVLWIIIAIIKKPTNKVKIVQEKGYAEENARKRRSTKKKRK